MTCPNCGASLLEDDSFCPQCGIAAKSAVRSCAVCDFPVREGAKFCIKCGSSVENAVPDARHESAYESRPERRPRRYAPSLAATPVRPKAAEQTLFRGDRSDAEHRHREKQHSTRRDKWPLAALALGCALGFAIYFSLSKNANTPETPSSHSPSPGRTAETASGTLGTTRLSSEDFPMKRAFIQLYGSYDPNLDGAFWKPRDTPIDFRRWEGKSVFVRPLISRPFEISGAARHLLVSNTLDVKDGEVVKQGTGCRACGSLIGAAIFEKHGPHWKLISRHDFLTVSGNWGAPPKVSVVFQSGGAIELQFENASETRETAKKSYSIVLKERKDAISAVARPAVRDTHTK